MTTLTKAQIEAMLPTLGEVSADGREACNAYAEDLARTAIALHDRVAELEGAISAEIAARKSYERLPVDRGGSQGPKGQARAKWLKARKDLAEALERTTP